MILSNWFKLRIPLIVAWKKKEFDGIKGVIRNGNSKDRQCNAQRTIIQTMVSKLLHIKLKIEPHKFHYKLEAHSGVLEGYQFPLH